MRPRPRPDAAPAHSPRSRLRAGARYVLRALVGALAALALTVGAGPAAAQAEPTTGQAASTAPQAQPAASTAPQAPAGPTEPAAQAAQSVTVSIDSLSPEVLTTGQDLTVTGTVTNSTSSDLAAPGLIIQMQSATDISSSQTQAWMSAQRDGPLSTVAMTTLQSSVAAGESTEFSVTIPAESLPLSDSAQWGPRGLQVVVTDSGDPVAQDRTLTVWDSGAGVQAARMTVVIPVVASPAEQVLLASSPAGLEESTTTNLSESVKSLRERVRRLLGLARPGVVLAVDPALLAALGVGTSASGASGSPDNTTGSPSASAGPATEGAESQPPQASESPASASSSGSPWTSAAQAQELTDALSAAMEAGEVIALPWADADLAALTHLGADSLRSSSLTRTQEAVATWPAATGQTGADEPGGSASGTPSASGRETTPAPTTVLASGSLDTTWLNLLPDSVTTVITEPGDLQPTKSLTYTPSGTAVEGGRAMLVPDAVLSSTASTRQDDSGDAVAPGGQKDAEPVAYSELDVRQHLRADTAVLTRQAPNLMRNVIVSIDRLSASTTDPEVLGQRVEALTASSWTAAASMADVVGEVRSQESAGTLLKRRTPPSTLTSDGELTGDELNQATATAIHTNSIASVLSSPEALLGTATDVTAWAASTSWRSAPSDRADLLTTVNGSTQRVVDGLGVAPMSTVNVIAESAELPVSLTSSLDQEATVVVRVTPESQRLQTHRTVTVTVPARGQATARIPIEAVGNGDVDLTVEVLAADGTSVGTSTVIHTRVRAGWETLGVRVTAGVLLLLLVVGVTRTIRNGRRGRPASRPPPEPSTPPAQETT